MKLVFKSLLLVFISHVSLYAQDGFFHPEADGGKWGVQRSYNKMDRKGNTDYVSEWTHKPKFDLVLYDTLRCRYTGNGCEGFFSFKKGKMGYLWKNGNTLDNEYEALDISNHIGRKNGKWGGFYEEKNILPFEYDSLISCTYSRPDQNKDTLSVKFAAKKNGKWKLIAVRSWTQWTQNQVSSLVPEVFDDYIKNFVVKKDGKWYFLKIDDNTAPVYSPPYDAIKFVGYWVVQKNGKWAPLEREKNTPSAAYEWDDIERCLSSSRYMVVKKDGLYGLMKAKSGFKVIVPPQASSISVESDKEDARIIAVINGVTTSFDWTGKMLSSNGDLSIAYAAVKGPFKINYHQDGKVTVTDSTSGKELLPKDYWVVDYENDAIEGHILKLKKLRYQGEQYGKHGRYQYSTGTLIEPIYDIEFTDFGPGHFRNSKSGGVFSEILFWSKKDYHQLKFPFRPTIATTWQGLLIRDDAKNWYSFAEVPVKLDPSTIIYRKQTWGSNFTYNEMEDGSSVLTGINGISMNKKVESIKSLYHDNMLEVKENGKTTTYCYDNQTVVPCAYTLGEGAYIRDCITGYESGPPVLLVDSASVTVLVNVLSNKRLVLPCSIVSTRDSSARKDAFGTYPYATFLNVNGTLYSLCKVSLTSPRLCREQKCICANGKVIAGTRTVGTPDKYVKASTTYTTKSNYEKVWNSKTNSYGGVTTKTTKSNTTPGYTIKGTEHEERIYEKCSRCSGTGRVSRTLTWNGSSFR